METSQKNFFDPEGNSEMMIKILSDFSDILHAVEPDNSSRILQRDLKTPILCNTLLILVILLYSYN